MEDDFVDLDPPASKPKRSTEGAVMVSHVNFGKAGPGKISLTIPAALLDELHMDTPRLSCAYSKTRSALRLTHQVNGPYELLSTPPGRSLEGSTCRQSKMLRVLVPEGVSPALKSREACRHEVRGDSLVVYLPPNWYPTYSSASRPPAKSPNLGHPPSADKSRTVVTEPGMPPPGRSALDQGAKPGGGLMTRR